ncbi:RAI1 [Lepeophtheirus salmonis]|uniref:Decapping nuclease n=1 Tax=Lepeophtheirus salmonis TaxID=72036 RepID=A0A7R8CU85_LEPSM|nr:RAI1 [Lepeophtheirus salmonis]CAF2934406.1 RAI1 [Lepeophtheirus salmonis]
MENPNIEISLNESPCSTICEPYLLGSFALNEKREWFEDAKPFLKVYDSSYWKEYPLRETPIDLRQYQSLWKGDDYFEEGNVPLLRWIHSHPQVLPADFVLSRGILAKMMRTPYEKYEPWYFSVVKHRNTFYFKQNETDYERRKETTIRNFYSKYFHWGNQFDYHLTKRITPDINNVLNVCQEYCGVYRRKVNDLCLLYNAEIDGVMMNHENNDPHRPEDFVEFKLTLAIQNERHFEKVAQRKFIRWWAQSFLVGIPRIVCGFRDYDGLVHEIKEYLTEEIPSSRGVTWKSSVCCNFLKDILSSLKNRSDLSSDVVYCISWTPPGMTINIKETEDSLESILPLWYTN